MAQLLHPNYVAKLIKIPGIVWETNSFSHDPTRVAYHERKMSSKDSRPKSQLNLLGSAACVGKVMHVISSYVNKDVIDRTVRFVMVDEPKYTAIREAIELFETDRCPNVLTVGVRNIADDLRCCVPLLDHIQTHRGKYLAIYEFPKYPDEQEVINSMFETDEADIEFVLLSSLKLMPTKLKKSNKNHRAELFIWIGAHKETDYPRHQPLWRNQHNEIEEGSSTFVSILHNFPPQVHPGLRVPCIYKLGGESTSNEPHILAHELNKALFFGAWIGNLSKVHSLLEQGASSDVIIDKYGHSAISKARALGFMDLVKAMEYFNLHNSKK